MIKDLIDGIMALVFILVIPHYIAVYLTPLMDGNIMPGGMLSASSGIVAYYFITRIQDRHDV